MRSTPWLTAALASAALALPGTAVAGPVDDVDTGTPCIPERVIACLHSEVRGGFTEGDEGLDQTEGNAQRSVRDAFRLVTGEELPEAP